MTFFISLTMYVFFKFVLFVVLPNEKLQEYEDYVNPMTN